MTGDWWSQDHPVEPQRNFRPHATPRSDAACVLEKDVDDLVACRTRGHVTSGPGWETDGEMRSTEEALSERLSRAQTVAKQ
jgi:hypothetical protein